MGAGGRVRGRKVGSMAGRKETVGSPMCFDSRIFRPKPEIGCEQ